MISKSALLIVGLGQKSSSSSGCIVGSSAPLGPTTSTASGGSTSCISASCGGSTGSARGMAFCFFKALAKQVFKKTCPFWSLFGFEKTCPFWSLFGFEKTGSSYFSGITPRMFPRWNVGANLWIEFVCNRKFKYVRVKWKFCTRICSETAGGTQQLCVNARAEEVRRFREQPRFFKLIYLGSTLAKIRKTVLPTNPPMLCFSKLFGVNPCEHKIDLNSHKFHLCFFHTFVWGQPLRI